MHQFAKSRERWWQKPLVAQNGGHLPAELAVLRIEMQAEETGAWLNSRGVKSAVIDFVRGPSGRFSTVRVALPAFVAAQFKALYERTGLAKGAPDLVVWNAAAKRVRFIEVKNPHWDRPSREQIAFLRAAEAMGLSVAIVEWEFESESDAA
jgi:hypothetical protein